MKCYFHPEIDAVAACSSCGKAICQSCSVNVSGRMTCKDCLSKGNLTNHQTSAMNPTNTFAVLSLILGIIGICGGAIFSIPAWILGSMAEKQIIENPNQEGNQLAKFGKIIGMVMTFIFGTLIIIYLAAVFIPMIGISIAAILEPLFQSR